MPHDAGNGDRPYVLAVIAVITDQHGRILLLKRGASSRFFKGQWELPGGKPEPGESFAEALIREVREETGLAVESTGLAGAVEFELPHVRVVQVCMAVRILAGTVVMSHEHEAFQWVQKDALLGMDLVPHQRRLLL